MGGIVLGKSYEHVYVECLLLVNIYDIIQIKTKLVASVKMQFLDKDSSVKFYLWTEVSAL